MPIEDERPTEFYTRNALIELARLAIGLEPIGSYDKVLMPLRGTSGYINRLMNHAMVSPDFHEALANIEPDYFYITGIGYRTAPQKAALKKKKKGSLILLMREPGNPHDPNAIMCLAAQTDPEARDVFHWRHVGYLPAHLAAQLAPHWYTIRSVPVILHATLAEVETATSYAKLSLTNEYSSAVNFRDISPMFEGILWDADDHPL